MLSIGIRKLQYRAPIFDAGVYRVAIQNGFQLYYEDDGHPPEAGDSPLYHEPFKIEKAPDSSSRALRNPRQLAEWHRIRLIFQIILFKDDIGH